MSALLFSTQFTENILITYQIHINMFSSQQRKLFKISPLVSNMTLPATSALFHTDVSAVNPADFCLMLYLKFYKV